MASKKIRDIALTHNSEGFSLFSKPDFSKKTYDFSDLATLRQLLSNEKARMIHVIKNQKPSSLYDLAKKLNRNFRQVFDDFYILKRFGVVDIIKEKVNSRIRYKPIIIADELTLNFKF